MGIHRARAAGQFPAPVPGAPPKWREDIIREFEAAGRDYGSYVANRLGRVGALLVQVGTDTDTPQLVRKLSLEVAYMLGITALPLPDRDVVAGLILDLFVDPATGKRRRRTPGIDEAVDLFARTIQRINQAVQRGEVEDGKRQLVMLLRGVQGLGE
jgi:hypothetical protein